MDLLKKLTIRTKLILALCMLTIIGLSLGLFNIIQSKQLSYLTSEMYHHPYTVSNTVRDIHINIITMHRDMKNVTLRDNPAELERLIEQVDSLEREVFTHFEKLYKIYLGDPKDIQYNERLFKNWRPIRMEVINKTFQNKTKEAAAITKGKGARYVKKLTDSIAHLVNFADKKAETFFENSQAKHDEILNITIIFFIFLIITALAAIYGVRRDITDPLNALVSLMKRIGSGNLQDKEYQSAVNLASRKDEIGSLFSSFEKMLRFIQEAYSSLENEKRYIETVIESNSTAIIAVNEEGTIMTYNHKAEELFGFTQAEMIDTKHLDFIVPKNYLAKHRHAFKKFVTSGATTISSEVKELFAQRKGGETFPIKLSFGLNTTDTKKIIIANIIDITYEKELVKELQERSLELLSLNHSLEDRVTDELLKNQLQLEQNFNQARLAQMGEMISMIAHQWRQPLSAVTSITTNLLIKMQLQATQAVDEAGKEQNNLLQEKLHDIDRIMQMLSETIDDFRNFYKPDKEKKTILIDKAVSKALGIIETSLRTKGIEFVKEYKAKKIVSVHESELMQVILNILKNAEDNFTEKGTKNPKIEIRSVDTPNGVVLTICDNGGGIPEDIINKVFTPYFSTKDEKNGTGLGLYMSKVIIEEHHNGTLAVHNQDSHCCFTITLKN